MVSLSVYVFCLAYALSSTATLVLVSEEVKVRPETSSVELRGPRPVWPTSTPAIEYDETLIGACDAEGAGVEPLLLSPPNGWAPPWLKASAKLPDTCVEV